jgi:hypothetical protein
MDKMLDKCLLRKEHLEKAALEATEAAYGPIVNAERTAYYMGYYKCYEDLLSSWESIYIPKEEVSGNN